MAASSGVNGAWLEGGLGLAGTHGVPKLSGAGDMTAGSTVTLTLAGALESAPVVLVVGFDVLLAPLKGGTLVPKPTLKFTGLVTERGVAEDRRLLGIVTANVLTDQ